MFRKWLSEILPRNSKIKDSNDYSQTKSLLATNITGIPVVRSGVHFFTDNSKFSGGVGFEVDLNLPIARLSDY